MNIKSLRIWGLGVLLVIALAVTWIGFSTYNPDLTNRSALFRLLVQYHLGIMVGMVCVSLAVGFLVAQILYHELQRQERQTRRILDVVLLFLSREEKEIVSFLVKQGGETTQSEISRLPGMTRVKAHRSLQRMEMKQLIEVIPHGKIRRIVLRTHILDTLKS